MWIPMSAFLLICGAMVVLGFRDKAQHRSERAGQTRDQANEAGELLRLAASGEASKGR